MKVFHYFFKYLLIISSFVFSFYGEAFERHQIEESLYSSMLGEQRQLIVSLPKNYSADKTKSYSVLYLLDPDKHMSHTISSLDYLNSYNITPNLIIVGIVNKNRTRDFTPNKSKEKPELNAGGASRFLDFMELELLPHIDKKYRTRNYKIFAGHSLGGLLVVNALLDKPFLFQAYFAYSPSLWWDKQVMENKANVLIKNVKELEGFLYINVGNESEKMTTAIHAFNELLGVNPPQKFQFKMESLLEESHVTTPLVGQIAALKALYKDW